MLRIESPSSLLMKSSPTRAPPHRAIIMHGAIYTVVTSIVSMHAPRPRRATGPRRHSGMQP